VPDVAGNADNASGYIVLVDGQWIPVGGTSAVAPLYAGLMALLNQALDHPVHGLLPMLYTQAADEKASVFRDITGRRQLSAEERVRARGPGIPGGRGLGRVHGPRQHRRDRVAGAAAFGEPGGGFRAVTVSVIARTTDWINGSSS
jgi:kumamolisin